MGAFIGEIRKGGRISMRKEVPIWEKANLTIEEAAAYSGIGENRIRGLTTSGCCPVVLWVGARRGIKRRKFDEFVESAFSI